MPRLKEGIITGDLEIVRALKQKEGFCDVVDHTHGFTGTLAQVLVDSADKRNRYGVCWFHLNLAIGVSSAFHLAVWEATH
jgi:hypothetical protein